MSKTLSYCADLVRAQRPDAFLQCLFVPAAHREGLLAFFALDAELAHVGDAVSEELMAQIRFAWWQEGLAEIAPGQKARAHPVLEALPLSMAKGGAALAESYRTHFPDPPPSRLEEIAAEWLRTHCPQAEQGWRKAGEIIEKHRVRFGAGGDGWLKIKLLWVGIF